MDAYQVCLQKQEAESFERFKRGGNWFKTDNRPDCAGLSGKSSISCKGQVAGHEQPHDYYRYTEFALRRFVENSGLKLIQLKSIGGAPEIMADIFAKTILRVPKIGRPLALFAQWITFCFINTTIGKKVSKATRNSFPFGYFLIAQKPE